MRLVDTLAPEAVPVRRVLVIDDDPTLRGIVAEVLQEEGYEVDTAPNGSAGVLLAYRRAYDAVVLDWRMPVSDGHDFVAAFRQLPCGATVPVVVVSAAPIGDGTLERDQVQAHLPKPFDLDTLVDTVRRLTAEHAPARAVGT